MGINIDESTMKNLIGESLLVALDQKARDTLIKEALTYLVTPATNSYGRGLSPIELAFQGAVKSIAEKLIREEFEKDDRKVQQIREIVDEAWVKNVTGEGRSKLVSQICAGIDKALCGREY